MSPTSRSPRRPVIAGLVAALASVSLACSTLSVEEERELGDQVRAQVHQEVRFVRDRVVERYVDDIGQELVAAAGPQPFDYHFYVVDSRELNAFAMPAGHVYIHTEIILKARNVSELAGVIAHEVGHVAERHVAENYNRQKTAGLLHQMGVIAAGVTLGTVGANAASLLGGLSALAVINSYPRDAEREADAFAVEVLPRAGYDPRGTVSFFKTLQAESPGGAPPFLASHPAPAERVEAARQAVDALPPAPGLRVDDSGRLEIIQRRIRLLTRRDASPPRGGSRR